MTWTYSNDPSNSQRDEVRLLIGDTDVTDQLVSDEEITYAVASGGSTMRGAAKLARVIAAKFARLTSASVGSVSEQAGDLWQHYRDLARDLDQKASIAATPTFGGLTIAEHERDNADTGLVQSEAKKNQYDNPMAVSNSERNIK